MSIVLGPVTNWRGHAVRTDDYDIRELHKERLEAEERFIAYFRNKYGTKR